MSRFFVLPLFLLLHFSSYAQDSISLSEVKRLIGFLASDSMLGRANGSPQLNEAARFISEEFAKDSLLFYPGYESYLQPFVLTENAYGVRVDSVRVCNVVGVLEGKTKPNEVVIFSAHYDHIGLEPDHQDGIFNGANDNASGTTALLVLANYFAKRNDNDRTLIFCAFAGEEWGLWGSEAFSRKIVCDSVVAMINIEMIGSRHGTRKRSFFITGADRSNLSKILRKNLNGSPYRIDAEPSREKMLFQRSDNFPFAQRGVPAHSLMCSDDSDPCYHKTCDEVEQLDLENMTEVIKAIALSVKTLVDGTATPKRIR
jgi:putative aminopeptidase FrvX